MKKTKIDHYTDKEALEFHNSNKVRKNRNCFIKTNDLQREI